MIDCYAMEYRIGEFSMLTRLPVKTLHFYHQEGLLEPSRVDGFTGYRWYGDAELGRAGLIAQLKGAGFTLAEIKVILAECREDQDLAAWMDRKLGQMDQKIKELNTAQAGLLRLRERLEQDEATARSGPGTGAESANLVQRPSVLYISRRFVGRYDQAGSRFGELFRLAKGAASGPPFCLYHHLEYREDDADIEVCLPVSREIPGAECLALAGGSWLETLHIGSYSELGHAYGRLFQAAAEQGLGAAAPACEIYLKGPGWFFPGRPANYRTLVGIPVFFPTSNSGR